MIVELKKPGLGPARFITARLAPGATPLILMVQPGGSGCAGLTKPLRRSEEHTSELQSHGLSSYAVFCLKKNTTRPGLVHLRAALPLQVNGAGRTRPPPLQVLLLGKSYDLGL